MVRAGLKRGRLPPPEGGPQRNHYGEEHAKGKGQPGDEHGNPTGHSQGQGDPPENDPNEHQNHPPHHQPTEMIGQTEPRVRNPCLTNSAIDRDGADNGSTVEEEDGQDGKEWRRLVAQKHDERAEQAAGDGWQTREDRDKEKEAAARARSPGGNHQWDATRQDGSHSKQRSSEDEMPCQTEKCIEHRRRLDTVGLGPVWTKNQGKRPHKRRENRGHARNDGSRGPAQTRAQIQVEMEGKAQMHLPQVVPLLFSWLKSLALALRLIMDGMNHDSSPSVVLWHRHPKRA